MGFPKPNKAPQIPNVIYNYFKKSLANFPTTEDFNQLPAVLVSVSEGAIFPDIKPLPTAIRHLFPNLKMGISAITGKRMFLGSFRDNTQHNYQRPITNTQHYDPHSILKTSLQEEKEELERQNMINKISHVNPSCLSDEKLTNLFDELVLDFLLLPSL